MHLVVRKGSGTNISGTKNISVGEHTLLFLFKRDFFLLDNILQLKAGL